VVSCSPGYDLDGACVQVHFEDGSAEVIDIWRLDRKCMVPGTLVEKRRWELGWRLDGAEPMTLDPGTPGLISLLVISCAWVVVAVVHGLVKKA
jgi:hypothetical protein